MVTPQTLHIPRGLWEDLRESIILADRQFVTYVAKELGLNTGEVLRKVLGTYGSAQIVHVLTSSNDNEGRCPWWNRYGSGLWRQCARQRCSPTLPCQFHATPTGIQRATLDVSALPRARPLRFKGVLYWLSPVSNDVFREDGTLETDIVFKQIDDGQGSTCYAAIQAQK